MKSNDTRIILSLKSLSSLFIPSVVFFLFMLLSPLAAQQTQRMYFIGNSVTDAMNYEGLKGLVTSRGNNYVLGSQRIPGSPLSFLWDNPQSGFTDNPYGYPTNAFAVYTWDVLSLQPFDRDIEGNGGDRETIGKYYNLMKSKSPDCKVFIYAHWPRTPSGVSELVATKEQYNSIWESSTNQEARKFYENLTTIVRADYPATENNIVMVPIGEVMYKLNNNSAFLTAAGISSIWGVYSDGIHMKGLGSYITACTVYAMAYHDDPAGLGAPGAFGTLPSAALPYIHQTIKDVIIEKSAFTKIDYFGAAPVKSIALNASAMELNIGKTAILTTIFTPSNAANQNVTWSSSNTLVATVLNDTVTAKAVGSSLITVTSNDGGFTATCKVTVTNTGTAVSGISLNKTTTSILEGENENVIATITPANATNKNVTWSSSDNTIATVDSIGIISALKKGAATITATSVNGLFSSSLVLSVTRTNHPPVAVLKYSPGNAGYAPYKITFDGRSSTDPDPGDFVLGYDWVVKKQGDVNNLSTQISNLFDYTFTEAGVYEVTLQAVDNDENLRSLNTEMVTITILGMPSVPVAETALCYEGFDYIIAPITGFNGGRGWKEGWDVQDPVGNTVNGFGIADAAPLTVYNLRQVGNYMKLGDSYSGIGRALDVSATGAFKNYLTGELIGKPGTTLWMSTIIRPMNNNKDCSLSLSGSGIAWYGDFEGGILMSMGCFGGNNWGLSFGRGDNRVVFNSTVPVVNNQAAFLVAKIEYGATNTVTLYVNSIPGTAPSVSGVVGTTTKSIASRAVNLRFSDGSDKMAIDEIRFGSTYADVAPANVYIPITSLTIISADNATSIGSGGTLQFSVNPSPIGASSGATWSIEPGTGTATIDGNGLLTAGNIGTVTVKAVSTDVESVHNTFTLTITPPVLVSSINLFSADNLTSLNTGNTLQFTADVLPANASNKNVTWSIVAGTGAATIDESGLLSATSAGTVSVKAVSKDGSLIQKTFDLTITTPVPGEGNLALTGVGTAWEDIPSANSTSDASKKTMEGLNDKDVSTDNSYSDASDTGNWQAAGILWASTQPSVTSVKFYNGVCLQLMDNGVFSADVKIQSSTDETTWTDAAGWSCSPSYEYGSASPSNQIYTFSGPALTNIKGIRVIGQVHTNDSWAIKVKEVEVFSAQTSVITAKGFYVSIYPNPAKDYLKVNYGYEVQNAHLEVFDVQGRQLISNTVNGTEANLDIQSLNKGIYILKAINGNDSKVIRFVKE